MVVFNIGLGIMKSGRRVEEELGCDLWILANIMLVPCNIWYLAQQLHNSMH